MSVLAALLAASAPPSADDWDGLGFLASIDRFDMDRFSPHPPGYPVYVAALDMAHAVTRNPLTAAYGVAIVSAVMTAALAFATAKRLWGPRAGWAVAYAVVATPLAWRTMSAVGTEALALAFAALAIWALVAMRNDHPRAVLALGAAVGLGLGVRLSWAPLFVSMLFVAARGKRVRAALVSACAVAVWAVPLVAIVGASHLNRLFGAHAQGHASRWGGTAITEPGVGRLTYLARDVFVDGLGADSDAPGVALGALAAALTIAGVALWSRASWRGGRSVLIVLLPYVAWIAVGQNLRQQPRHALPVVVALAVGLAVTASRTPRLRVLGSTLALFVATRTALDAAQRRAIPPPGAQLVAFATQLPDARTVAVFAGPSARFFETTTFRNRAASTPSLDDARLALTRLNEYPRRVLVTDELEGIDGAHLPLVATFCRPARLDRRMPCLRVFEWSLTPLAPGPR